MELGNTIVSIEKNKIFMFSGWQICTNACEFKFNASVFKYLKLLNLFGFNLEPNDVI